MQFNREQKKRYPFHSIFVGNTQKLLFGFRKQEKAAGKNKNTITYNPDENKSKKIQNCFIAYIYVYYCYSPDLQLYDN